MLDLGQRQQWRDRRHSLFVCALPDVVVVSVSFWFTYFILFCFILCVCCRLCYSLRSLANAKSTSSMSCRAVSRQWRTSIFVLMPESFSSYLRMIQWWMTSEALMCWMNDAWWLDWNLSRIWSDGGECVVVMVVALANYCHRWIAERLPVVDVDDERIARASE